MTKNPYAGNPSQRNQINSERNKTQSNSKKPARIWNVFKPTIVLDELSLDDKNNSSSSQKTEDYASLSYPLIKINDHIFAPEEISSFVIDSRGFLPVITLQVIFGSKLFISKSMPKDGDIISVMIRNKNDILNPIRNDYVITGAPSKAIFPNDNTPISLTFFGELFIPGLKSYLGSASFKGTSMEILKSVAKKLTIGFNSNEEETDDKMIWIISGAPEAFIKEVTSKAWKNENSFFDCWIDVYYNLNFVNIQKILLAPEEEIDPQAFLSNLDSEFTWGAKTDQNKLSAIPKVLSNFPGYKTSSSYITSWKSINKSSAITFDFGTSMGCTFFEHLDLLFNDAGSQKYWDLDINPKYDPQKINSHILLRGRAKWDPTTNEGEQALANYSYKEIYKRIPWLGIQYTITNPNDDPNKWTGNHHQNYMRAQVHNLVNSVELDKLNLEIKVKGTNTSIIRGDKIPLVLIKGSPYEAQAANPSVLPDQSVDFFYTGWYYIKGFNLSWAKNRNEGTSSFSQNYILTRREWSPPEPVEPIKEENNQI